MRRGLLIVLLVAWPTAVAAQSPILERAVDLANGAALVAHAADYGSTVRCTTAGTCVEANPILRPFVGGDEPAQIKFFAVKWSTALASYWVKTRTKARHPWLTLALASTETVAFLLIAEHNRRLHHRAQ